MFEVLRALLRWWSTDTFVKTGALFIVLGVLYFVVELFGAAISNPFIQFWIGVAVALVFYGASSWYQQVPQLAIRWHVGGFLMLVATMCWLQFAYEILNPWFVCLVCAIALWRLFIQSHQHRSAMVLAAGFFGGALVPPILFAELFTPTITVMSFAAWWAVGLLVTFWYRAWPLGNWLSVIFILLITAFLSLTGTTLSLPLTVLIVLLLAIWFFVNTLSFHQFFSKVAVSSRWYEIAGVATAVAAVVWIPTNLFVGLLGVYSLLLFSLLLFGYYPSVRRNRMVSFILASTAYFAVLAVAVTSLVSALLLVVWGLYTVWWVFKNYPAALHYTILVWLIPAAFVVWHQLLTPEAVIGFAGVCLGIATVALLKRHSSVGVLYFVAGWTLLVAGIVFMFLPLTITSAFSVLLLVGLIGVVGLMISIRAQLPRVFFLVTLGSVVAGLCSVYLLGSAELSTTSYLGWGLSGLAAVWGGMGVAFLGSYRRRARVEQTVIWTLIVVGSLPTLLMVAWLVSPLPFMVSALFSSLLYVLFLVRSLRNRQLVLAFIPWLLVMVCLGGLVAALLIAYGMVYTLSYFISVVAGMSLAVMVAVRLRKGATSLKKFFLLPYMCTQLTAWVMGLVALTIITVRVAPAGQSSLYLLAVLLVVSYTLTHLARVWGDWGLHRVSYFVLLIVLARGLSVEAWRLPDSLVLVPFLLTGIVLISLTMKQHNRTL